MQVRRVFAAVILLLSGLLGQALAEYHYHIPQVATGRAGELSVRTTFLILNPSPQTASVRFDFRREDGSIFFGMPYKQTVGPRQTVFAPTSSVVDLTVGGGTVISDQEVIVSAVFSFYLNGSLVTETGVAMAEPTRRFVLPVDAAGGANTAVAMFNPGDETTELVFRLFDPEGRERASRTRALGALRHMASFVAGELFEEVRDFRGTLWVEGSRPLTALVVRQQAEASGAMASYTTLPVMDADSARRSFTLPQVADGLFEGGSCRTGFLLFNLSASPAQATLRLTDGEGGPLAARLAGKEDEEGGHVLELGPRGSLFLETGGEGELRIGAARVESDQPLGAAAVFSFYDPAGRVITEAGVGNREGAAELAFPVQMDSGCDTGLALFNGAGTIDVKLELWGEDGKLVESYWPGPLRAGEHAAVFVSELFPGTRTASRSPFRGTLVVRAGGPVWALALRQDPRVFSLTTLPAGRPWAQEEQEREPAAPLLGKTTELAVGGDQELEVRLAAAGRLEGTIRVAGGGYPARLAADCDGVRYDAWLDPMSGRYELTAPPGECRLRVCYRAGGFLRPTLLTWETAEPVAIAGVAELDLQIPEVELREVSGRLSFEFWGWEERVDVVFSDGEARQGARMRVRPDGSYRGWLPDGEYVAGLALEGADWGPMPRVPDRWSILIGRAGGLQVRGEPARLDLQVPAIRGGLWGGVGEKMGPEITAGSGPTVFAEEITERAYNPGDCACWAGQSRGFMKKHPTWMAGYLLPLPAGDYRVQARVGTFGYYGQWRCSFVVPRVPREMTVEEVEEVSFYIVAESHISWPRLHTSGRVLDAEGRAVQGVSVLARAEIEGLDARYEYECRTDADGRFQLELLAGGQYRITFSPPTTDWAISPAAAP